MDTPHSHARNKLPQIGLAILLALVFLVEEVVAISAAAANIQQSPSSFSLLALCIATIITFWVHYDSRSLNISMGLDQAMLIFSAWPITFPLYAFRSRGFRSGSLLLLSFLGLFVFTFIAGIVIGILVSFGVSVFSTG